MNTNRVILVDNATLSGVERITGKTKTFNLNTVDNDILCLEKLITAILFSDKLLAIDDYKEEHRASRIKSFNYIEFIKIEDSVYSSLAADSANFAKKMTFSFQGSKPAGDVVKFFESLRLSPQLRWDIFVSSEYLTLSFLVPHTQNSSREKSIDGLFGNELSNKLATSVNTDPQPSISVTNRSDIDDIKKLVQAFKSENPHYAGEDQKSSLNNMIFGYGWVAERSHFYNAVAAMQGADVYLAPLRDAFCESCYHIDTSSQATMLIQELKNKSQKTLSSILEPGGEASFAMRLPFFLTYFISKTENPEQCIDLALKLRREPEFQDCRTIFHNMVHLNTSDKRKEINNILNYLDQSCTKLMKKYAVSTPNGIQFSLSLGLTGPKFAATGKMSQLFRHYKNRPFSRVFRNIAHDMINVERLGGLYEKVCSSVVKHPMARYPEFRMTPRSLENTDNQYSRPANLSSE